MNIKTIAVSALLLAGAAYASKTPAEDKGVASKAAVPEVKPITSTSGAASEKPASEPAPEPASEPAPKPVGRGVLFWGGCSALAVLSIAGGVFAYKKYQEGKSEL
jgi:hypothetical protein